MLEKLYAHLEKYEAQLAMAKARVEVVKEMIKEEEANSILAVEEE
jgi:hypothetical protein